MALKPVTDPALLQQLGKPTGNILPVSDPNLLRQLNGEEPEAPGALESGALGVMSGVPLAETALSAGKAALGDKTYEEEHQNFENLKNQAWEEHPVAYGTGKAAGLVGTAVVAPEGIPGALAIGAASGIDAATKPSDMIENAVKGGVIGGAVGTAAEKVISPAIEGLVNKVAPAIGKRAVASLGKPTVEDVESYLANPEAINNAPNNIQMAEQLANRTQDVGKAAGQLSEEAKSTLNSNTMMHQAPVDNEGLASMFHDLSQKYLTNGVPATAADETALKTLNSQYERLVNLSNTNNGEIPEDILKTVIQKLQGVVNENTWGNPDASAAQEALKGLTGRLNATLKTANPAYAEAQIPVAELSELKSGLGKKFGLDIGTGGEVNATEATNTKMGNILNENKTESQDLLNQLKEKTGIDFLDLAQKAKTKEAFTSGSGSSQGLNVIAHAGGYGVGALTNLPGGRLIGSLLGGAIGHNIDGGAVAKNILDMYLSGSEKWATSPVSGALKTYGPLLVNAAKIGGNQLAATHFVLATSHPEYQELMQHVQDNPSSTQE